MPYMGMPIYEQEEGKRRGNRLGGREKKRAVSERRTSVVRAFRSRDHVIDVNTKSAILLIHGETSAKNTTDEKKRV